MWRPIEGSSWNVKLPTTRPVYPTLLMIAYVVVYAKSLTRDPLVSHPRLPVRKILIQTPWRGSAVQGFPALIQLRTSTNGDEDTFLDSQGMPLLGVGGFDDEEDDEEARILSYLPESGKNIPPEARNLIRLATENYVTGAKNDVLRSISEVIETEHRVIDVPLNIGNTTIDVSQTGEEADEMVAEIMSLAALYRLPAEIALELLGGNVTNCTSSATEGMTKGNSSLDICREVFAQEGWKAVSFPKGLAVELKRRYTVDTSYQRPPRSISFQRKQRRLQFAERVVEEAMRTRAPKQKRQSKEEFLARMESLGISPAGTASANDGLLFFPNSTPLQGFSWKRVRRTLEKQTARLKARGLAGLVSYCAMNFLLYTFGIMWQWRRVATPDPPSTSSALLYCSQKFCRVFLSSVVASQVLKIPKIIASVALAPFAGRFLRTYQQRSGLSERLVAVTTIASMVCVWLAIISVPIISEYSNARRLVQSEKLIGGTASLPVW